MALALDDEGNLSHVHVLSVKVRNIHKYFMWRASLRKWRFWIPKAPYPKGQARRHTPPMVEGLVTSLKKCYVFHYINIYFFVLLHSLSSFDYVDPKCMITSIASFLWETNKNTKRIRQMISTERRSWATRTRLSPPVLTEICWNDLHYPSPF
jgi:hypothetical protein